MFAVNRRHIIEYIINIIYWIGNIASRLVRFLLNLRLAAPRPRDRGSGEPLANGLHDEADPLQPIVV